jgi:hypothetical protein
MLRKIIQAFWARVILLFYYTNCSAVDNERVFISFGSDDWGRWSNSLPVWPNQEARLSATNQIGWLSGGMPMMSTAETQADIFYLRKLIEEINQNAPYQQSLILTPYFVVAGPDYESMRGLGCPYTSTCEYRELFWHNSSGGLARQPYDRGDLRRAYFDLLRDGLWHPEYHGRSHFDTRAWVNYLRSGDQYARYYFDRGMAFYHFGLRDPITNTTHTIHCEYQSDDPVYQVSTDETSASHSKVPAHPATLSQCFQTD